MFSMRVRNVVNAMSVVGVVSSLAACSPAPKLEVVLWRGAVTPDGSAQYLIQLNNPATIQGDYISLNTNLSNSKDALVVNRKGGETRIVAETGMTTPTEHTFSYIANNGGPGVSKNGLVASPVTSYLSINPNATTSELIASDFNGDLHYLVSSGDLEPSGDGTLFIRTPLSPSVNAAGQVAASVSLSGTSGGSIDDEAIFRFDTATGDIQEIVRKGDTVPNGQGQFAGTSYQASQVFYNPYIADDGSVAFSASITGGTGIYVGNGVGIEEVVSVGRALPGATGTTLYGIWGLDYAANGLLAFTGHISSDGSPDAVYLVDGTNISKIMDPNDTAANGEHFAGPSITVKASSNGKVAFQARLYPSGKRGVFVGDGIAITQLALQGEAAPENHGVFAAFFEGSEGYSISDNGLIAFEGSLVKDGQNHKAVYFYGGDEVQEVISTFDSIDGGQVVGLTLAGRIDAQAEAINDAGDTLFKFKLADGRQGVAVWRRKG